MKLESQIIRQLFLNSSNFEPQYFHKLYSYRINLGFETNLNNNASRKELKYRPFLTDLACGYKRAIGR